MKLLLIKDEKQPEKLPHILRKHGYIIDTSINSNDGMELAVAGDYDIIIVDNPLPTGGCLSFLTEFRSYGFNTPVVILTSRDQEGIEALNSGADDYLIKPFAVEELLARLGALGRRRNADLADNILKAAGLTLDPLRHEAVTDEGVFHLTVKESQLLELLMLNHGHVITKERIYEKIWGYNAEVCISNVDLYIHYLRKKIKTCKIRTARGIGYFLQNDQKSSPGR